MPGLRHFGLLFGCVVLAGGGTAALYFLAQNAVPQFLPLFTGLLTEAFLGLMFLVIGVGLTHRYMNRPSAFNANLAANSYYFYLVHYPLI